MQRQTEHKKSSQVLLLVDVVNHFEFPDGDKILKNALPLAPRLARLKERGRRAGIPTVYVNDNFGEWRSDAAKLLAYCLRAGCPGKKFVEQIKPDEDDYCVLKPMHSAFYQTPLDVLLRHLGCRSIVVAGLTTNSCILCTAHAANMRDLELTVVSDCCAARSRQEHNEALKNIKEMAGGHVLTLDALRFRRDGRPIPHIEA
jgi:nicotinamidase-related amidase